MASLLKRAENDFCQRFSTLLSIPPVPTVYDSYKEKYYARLLGCHTEGQIEVVARKVAEDLKKDSEHLPEVIRKVIDKELDKLTNVVRTKGSMQLNFTRARQVMKDRGEQFSDAELSDYMYRMEGGADVGVAAGVWAGVAVGVTTGVGVGEGFGVREPHATTIIPPARRATTTLVNLIGQSFFWSSKAFPLSLLLWRLFLLLGGWLRYPPFQRVDLDLHNPLRFHRLQVIHNQGPQGFRRQLIIVLLPALVAYLGRNVLHYNEELPKPDVSSYD